jgi:hypothetical protein
MGADFRQAGSCPMIESPEELRALLADSEWQDAACVRLPMSGGAQSALALQVTSYNAVCAWRHLRDRIAVTGRWPVVTVAWTGHAAWARNMAEADFFSRFEYGHVRPGSERIDQSAQAILARSRDVDIDGFLQDCDGYWEARMDEFIGFQLEAMVHRRGNAPDRVEAARAAASVEAPKVRAVERFLLDWEIAQSGLSQVLGEADLTYLDWFEPGGQPMALLLMPFTRGSELLAHMHWFGAGSISSETAIAFLRRWEDRYGAELVAHYGTMLQMTVARRPADIGEAFELAWEHERVAPSTTALPGVTLRDHAKALLKTDRWFLHERP